MIFRHPQFRVLRAFALNELDANAAARVAKHAAGCARCRQRIAWVRDIVAAARRPEAGPPPPFEAVAARIRRGDRVLLPVGEPEAGASHGRRRGGGLRRGRVAAAVAGAALIAGAVLLGVPEAGAERSELWIVPERPTAGATLELRYRATARLAGEDRLVVRARYRSPGPSPDAVTAAVGEVRRVRGDWYEGAVTLPDSAVYLVLAVEDTAATFVDDHGERWEVVVHGEDGLPLYEALYQRWTDMRLRDTREAETSLHRMTDLYPDEPAGWYLHFAMESSRLPQAEVDSLRDAYRADFPRLEAAVRAEGEPGPRDYWNLAMLASNLGDMEQRDRLRRELMERYPADPGALQQASFTAAQTHRGDAVAFLAALDSLWALAPDAAVQVAFDGFRMAQQFRDPELMLRWAERLEATRPEWAPGHGITLSAMPETRDAGMARLRDAIAELSADPGERSLNLTAAEHEAQRNRVAGHYLVALGQALLADDRPRAALDTLDRALETGWNTALFQAVGDARLELGDTAGALVAFARLAVDPNTSAALADSLVARLDDAFDADAWDAAVRAGRRELRDEVFTASLNRAPLRDRLRLREPGGAAREVRLDEGGITVVAFWSRYCPPSAADLDALDAVARRLDADGVRFLGIADEEDGDAVAAYLRQRGLNMPVYLDPHRDARNAFDNRGFPHYVVVDADGRIRFTSLRAEDLLRHVTVLRG